MNRNLNRRIHPIAEADWLSPKKHRKDEHQRKFIAKTYAIYREILHKVVNNGVYKYPTLTCEEGGELPIIEEVEE